MQTDKTTKYVLNGITIWIILQIPRLIAIPIIQDVLSGVDDGEWMYPAILDIVVAVLSPIAIWMIWKTKNVYSWTFLICYFIISIIDHGNAVTVSSLAKIPQTFLKMGAKEAGFTPLWQAIVDLICIVLLCSKNLRKYFKIHI